eukprot:219604-Prymnesium_polylepis.1
MAQDDEDRLYVLHPDKRFDEEGPEWLNGEKRGLAADGAMAGAISVRYATTPVGRATRPQHT